MHRSDDAGPVVGRDHRRPADRVRLRRGCASARPRQLLRHPARPRATGAACPTGSAAVWRTQDAGSSWRRLDRGLPAARRAPRRPARGHGDRLLRRARPLLRHEHGAGVRERRRGRELGRDRQLPARRSRRSRSRSSRSHGRRPSPGDPAAALPRPAAPRRGGGRDRRRRDRASSTRAGPACATGCACPGPSCARTSTSTSTRSAPGSRRRSARARAST